MTIVAVSNQKGGVGKTTIAFNLAKGLATRGQRVLVIDNDPQGNLTHALLAEPEALTAEILTYYKPDAVNAIPQPVARNLFLLGANQRLATVTDLQIDDAIFGLKEGLERLRGDYDYILIDCLPSFGVLQLAALMAADEVLIPVTPANFSVQGLTSLFETITRAQKRFNENLSILGIILNRVEGRHTTIGGMGKKKNARAEKPRGVPFTPGCPAGTPARAGRGFEPSRRSCRVPARIAAAPRAARPP